jgi:hypothetical protein
MGPSIAHYPLENKSWREGGPPSTTDGGEVNCLMQEAAPVTTVLNKVGTSLGGMIGD